MVYYNTTNLKGDELKTSQKKTASQEQKVLKIFINLNYLYLKNKKHLVLNGKMK